MTYEKKHLTLDAKIIWMLHKKQPLTLDSLVKEMGLKNKSLKNLKYRQIRFLLDHEIVRDIVKNGQIFYALSDYSDLYEKVARFLVEWKREHDFPPTLDKIIIGLGENPENQGNRDEVCSTSLKLGWMPPPQVTHKDREIHTRDLKEVLAKWIQQIPEVSQYDVTLVASYQGPELLVMYKGEKLAVEKETLFEDLRRHLKPEIFSDYSQLAENANLFDETRKSVSSEIDESVKNLEGRMFNGCKLESVTPEFCELVFKMMFRRIIYQRGEYPHWPKDYEMFKELKLERRDNSLECRVLSIMAFRVTGNTEDLERLKANVTPLVQSIVTLMEDSSFETKLEDLRSKLDQLRDFRDKLVRMLEEYRNVPTLLGDCRILFKLQDLILPVEREYS